MGKKQRRRGGAALRRYWRDVRALADATKRTVAEARRLASVVRKDEAGRIRPRVDQAKAAKREIRKAKKQTLEFSRRKLKGPKKGKKTRRPPAEPTEEQLEALATGEAPEAAPIEVNRQGLMYLKELMGRLTALGFALAIFTPAGDVEAAGGAADNGLAAHRDLWRLVEPYAKQLKPFDKYWFLQPWFRVEIDEAGKLASFFYEGPTV